MTRARAPQLTGRDSGASMVDERITVLQWLGSLGDGLACLEDDSESRWGSKASVGSWKSSSSLGLERLVLVVGTRGDGTCGCRLSFEGTFG
jgi:hypothetical protein